MLRVLWVNFPAIKRGLRTSGECDIKTVGSLDEARIELEVAAYDVVLLNYNALNNGFGWFELLKLRPSAIFVYDVPLGIDIQDCLPENVSDVLEEFPPNAVVDTFLLKYWRRHAFKRLVTVEEAAIKVTRAFANVGSGVSKSVSVDK